jgi:hypothetical protein
MPIEFTCPECRQRVQVSEVLAGLHTRCPNCTAPVNVPDSSSPPDATGVTARPGDAGPRDAWEPPRSQWADDRPLRDDYGFVRRDADVSGWQVTGYAITLEYIAMVMLFCLYLGMFLFQCVLLNSPAVLGGGGMGAVQLMGCVLLLMGLVLIAAIIIMIVGRCMACMVPSASGTKGLAISSIISLGLAVLLGVVAFLMVLADIGGRRGRGPETAVVGLAMIVAAFLLGLGSHILYQLFLRGVAAYLGNSPLAGRIVAYLVASIVIPVVMVALLIVLGVGMARMPGQDPRGMVLMTMVLQAIVTLGLLGWYISLLGQLRETVRNMGPRTLS